eukprot:1134420-Pyramimonas_sp.AAC.1
MTLASRLSPEVDLARIENVVSIRLTKSIHKLALATYADTCSLVHYGNDVKPGFRYYEAEGTALNIYDATGSAHSRITQCLKSTKPQAGLDQDVTNFEELADVPT